MNIKTRAENSTQYLMAKVLSKMNSSVYTSKTVHFIITWVIRNRAEVSALVLSCAYFLKNIKNQ